ncbi:hypothetical protein [Nocardia terpenica]|uniref:Uncharacterized protein n=1 Tax=Nocardia terpenica TaxID=455432 RepID=A0A6G9ZCJ7_9NOCA|nr:hypothetical protein [Nocardia terpenica]QIS23121.1 hypothetical protein F6W96_37050 [Nocardia terpenica]
MSDSGFRSAPGADPFDAYRMPTAVRAARWIALSTAGVGIVCTAAAGWLFGARSALMIALSFVPNWLLGVVALAFGAVGDGIRVGAVLLAALSMLWTVPSIMLGHPPGWLGPAGALAMIVLLFRPSARAWFVPHARAPGG